MYVTESSQLGEFGEFGIIIQGIVAAVQGVTLGAAAAVEHQGVKKYLKKEGRTFQIERDEALKVTKQHLANKERLLRVQGQIELTKDANVKKLVILGSVTLTVVTLVGLGAYYMVSVGDDDE